MKTKIFKYYIFIVAILLIVTVAFSTDKIDFEKITNLISKENPQIVDDTIKTNQPKVDIKVNKELDENGNVISYDSTYTYFYSNSDGNMEEMDIDSIFNSFQPYFFEHSEEFMKSPFEKFFKSDPFLKDNFFKDDFFQNQFEDNMFQFEDMMKMMDSLRNDFLKQATPGNSPKHQFKFEDNKSDDKKKNNNNGKVIKI